MGVNNIFKYFENMIGVNTPQVRTLEKILKRNGNTYGESRQPDHTGLCKLCKDLGINFYSYYTSLKGFTK